MSLMVEAPMYQSFADREFRRLMDEWLEDALIAGGIAAEQERAAWDEHEFPTMPGDGTEHTVDALTAALAVTDKRGSYMIADVEYDLERIRVEFTMPLGVAQELMGHALNAEEYEEAQFYVNEFVDRITEVMGRALFGPEAVE